MLKRLAVLAFFCAAAAATTTAHAQAISGLEDGDSIRSGFTATTTVPRNYSSGGVGFHIYGRKRAASQPTAEVSLPSRQLTAFMDYDLLIKHVDDDKIIKFEMKSGDGGPAYVLNESFSGELSGKELNAAFVKARSECPDCGTFFFVVSQDTGWGSFDILPIRNYTGAHSLNHKPSAMHKKDPNGKNEGFTVFNSFIDYLPAGH